MHAPAKHGKYTDPCGAYTCVAIKMIHSGHVLCSLFALSMFLKSEHHALALLAVLSLTLAQLCCHLHFQAG